MLFQYEKGFNVIESGKPGPVFIAPHSALTYRSSEREDVGSENVAFLAVQVLGGSAIISTIPRHGMLGIDYNRLMPERSMVAKDMGYIRANQKLTDYYKNYAWVSMSNYQYNAKKKVYGNFWKTAERLGSRQKRPFYVFCHTLSSRIKNLPTAIDLVTGRGMWLDTEKVRKVAARLNKKYNFNKYKKDWLIDMKFHAMQEKNLFEQCFFSFKGIRREWMVQDLETANRILRKNYSIRKLTFEKYYRITEQVLKKSDLKITVENAYHGDTAKPVGSLLKKTNGIALEVESQSFLNEHHTKDVVGVIGEVVKGSE